VYVQDECCARESTAGRARLLVHAAYSKEECIGVGPTGIQGSGGRLELCIFGLLYIRLL